MKRNTLNFIVDVLSALVIFGLVATGLVIRFTLPPGSGSVRSLWSLGRHDWGDVHFWLAVAAAGVLVIHVALHWTWICVAVQRLLWGGKHSSPPATTATNVYGVAFLLFLVAVFGGFMLVANSSVASGPSGQPPGHRGVLDSDAQEHSGGAVGVDREVRGSMTLNELAATTGISAETIKKELGLPATVPGDERLNSLMAQYNFRMSQLRRIIEEQAKAPSGGHDD